MISFFLFYEQAGIVQLDMIGMATFSEYLVFGRTLIDTTEDFAPYEHGTFPWRTGAQYITAVVFFILLLFTKTTVEHVVFFTQFFFGSMAVVFLYLFLLELYEKHFPAIIGALVFGLSAPLFNAVLSKDHGTEFFFAFCAMYLLLLGIKRKSTIVLFISNISLGFLLWMREGALFFPVIYYGFFLVHVCSFNKESKYKISFDKTIFTKQNIVVLTIPYIVLTIIAFKLYVWLLLTVALEKSNAGFFTYAKDIIISIVDWYPLLYFFFVVLGLFFTVKNKEKISFFFFSISILFLLVFTKNATFDLRHLGIYIFFPLSVIICYGIILWQEQLRDWKKYLTIILAVLLCVQVFVPGIPLFEQRKEHIYTKEFSEGIAAVVPQDGVVFMYDDFCLFIVYYGKRECRSLPDNFFSTVDPILESGKRVFVPFEAGFGFYDDNLKAAIEEQYSLTVVYEGKFENYHHADLKSQVYDEMLIEVKLK